MNRCLRWASTVMLALSLALFASAGWAQTLVQRTFPADALRGKLSIVQPPVSTLNGRPARLAPGARIRGENNLLVMSGSLVGRELTVNYTMDPLGLVKDVWILRADEIKQLWPTTREDAARWAFDPTANAWARR